MRRYRNGRHGNRGLSLQITALFIENDSGKTLSSVPVSKSFILNAEITENTARNEQDYLVIAVYGTDGALLSINHMKCDFITGKTLSVGQNIQPQSKQIGAIKAFVWDSMGTMKPPVQSQEL